MCPYLLPHFPQALQTMEHVAAPQQLAAKDMNCSGGMWLASMVRVTYSTGVETYRACARQQQGWYG